MTIAERDSDSETFNGACAAELAIEHPKPNVWVIDPHRRNGHRLDEGTSIDDIFREHDTAEKAFQTTAEVDGTDIGRRVREELAKREVQRLVAEHLAEAKIDADVHRAMSGLDFLERDLDSDPVWGDGNEVLWAKGEGAVIAGPQGTGKSTLAQQLCLRRLGIFKSKLLGYRVAADDRPVLYLAMDRPPQIRRSLRRMVALADQDARTVLRERLVVWSGPVPVKANEAPKTFCEWVRRRGREPGLVIVDSLKDLVSGLIDDAHGIGFNDAMQMVLETLGCEFLTLHHQRKPTVGNSKPNKLADLYGNTWFTAGQGSVISLWGQPGDAAVELSHLKQPQEKVGPLTVNHRTLPAQAFLWTSLHNCWNTRWPGVDRFRQRPSHEGCMALRTTRTYRKRSGPRFAGNWTSWLDRARSSTRPERQAATAEARRTPCGRSHAD